MIYIGPYVIATQSKVLQTQKLKDVCPKKDCFNYGNHIYDNFCSRCGSPKATINEDTFVLRVNPNSMDRQVQIRHLHCAYSASQSLSNNRQRDFYYYQHRGNVDEPMRDVFTASELLPTSTDLTGIDTLQEIDKFCNAQAAPLAVLREQYDEVIVQWGILNWLEKGDF